MRKIILSLLVISPLVSFAQDSNLSEGYEWMTKNCNDIACVQDNIGLIDGQIAALVAKRLAYVKRGAEIKNHNVLMSKEPGGYTASSAETTGEAKDMGTSPAAARGVFKALDQQSKDYEKKFLKRAPGQPQAQPQAPEQVQVQPQVVEPEPQPLPEPQPQQ
ncbi:MAG: hypothetical protein M3R00_02245 [Pseudomonadota bacterium]|nr:hypothetical protein [Pseudomonadota bacterium]